MSLAKIQATSRRATEGEASSDGKIGQDVAIDKLPIDLVIETLEQAFACGLIKRSELQAQALSDPCRKIQREQVLWWLDHTLSLLVNRGMLRRRHLEPGELGYVPTPEWKGRSRVLAPLGPPPKKNRFARDRARQEAKERRRQERARLAWERSQVRCMPGNTGAHASG